MDSVRCWRLELEERTESSCGMVEMGDSPLGESERVVRDATRDPKNVRQ